MTWLSSFGRGVLDMMFPEYCPGCGQLIAEGEYGLCLLCLGLLPMTDFHTYPKNPLYTQLEGRIPLSAASAGFYFKKGNRVQKIMHGIKYRRHWKAARVLGRYYGQTLRSFEAFQGLDWIIPVPLQAKRLAERGFNQSEEFAIGLSESMGIPVHTLCLYREKQSDSQSHKAREERFSVLSGDFRLKNPSELAHKKILLTDDLITTGATLEACSRLLYPASGELLTLVTMAYTAK